jgi:hypothetical protein
MPWVAKWLRHVRRVRSFSIAARFIFGGTNLMSTAEKRVCIPYSARPVVILQSGQQVNATWHAKCLEKYPIRMEAAR